MPSASPKQDTEVAVTATSTAGGSVKVTLPVMLHPPASVAVTKYVPATRPVRLGPLPTGAPPAAVHSNVNPPPRPPVATASAVPSSNPLQLGSVEKAKTSTGGMSTVTMASSVHPLASVAVTRMDCSQMPVAVPPV